MKKKVLRPPSFLTKEERRLQSNIELILLEYAEDHRMRYRKDIDGWVVPALMELVLKTRHSEKIKWYYKGLFDGFDVDEYGEKRQFTEMDMTYALYCFKEKLLEQINKLDEDIFTIPAIGLKKITIKKSEVLALIKK